jgi:ribosome modulation factor
LSIALLSGLGCDNVLYNTLNGVPDVTAPALPESLTRTLPTLEEAYRMGRDYALNGANEENCHFRQFATPEHLRAWEEGKADAVTGK